MKIKNRTVPIYQLANELIKLPEAIGVILFGSYARGEMHEGSDVDLVVIYENKEIARKMWNEEIKILTKYDGLHQVLSFGKEELIESPIRRSLIRDGILLCSKNSETKETLLSVEVPVMSDKTHHEKDAKENWLALNQNFTSGYYSAVGFLAIKVLEQAIEACVSKEDIHFHDHPATAHDKRKEWLEKNHPEIADCWETLWKAYGDLGYAGRDGKLAKETIEALKRALEVLCKKENLNIL